MPRTPSQFAHILDLFVFFFFVFSMVLLCFLLGSLGCSGVSGFGITWEELPTTSMLMQINTYALFTHLWQHNHCAEAVSHILCGHTFVCTQGTAAALYVFACFSVWANRQLFLQRGRQQHQDLKVQSETWRNPNIKVFIAFQITNRSP